MAENTTSQSQQKNAQTEQAEQWMAEFAKLDGEMVEQWKKTVQESTKLFMESMSYGARLREEGRKLMLDMLKRAPTMPWV